MIHIRTLKNLLWPWLGWIALLNLLGAVLVALFWLIAGDGPEGIGPYLDAVSRAGQSPKDLLVYTVCVMAYSVIIELALRLLIQKPLTNHKHSAAFAIFIAAIAYGMSHLVHNPAGALYATALGGCSALVYHKTRDLRAMVGWHVQWNLLAIGGTLLLAMAHNGDARAHFLYEYKAHQVEAGKLVYNPGWGWVDLDHYEVHDYDRALDWTRDASKETLTLHATIHGVFGDEHPVSRTYKLTVDPRTPSDRWAAACSATLDFSIYYEQRQLELPWILGTRMSAFQPDDATSTLFLCLNSSAPDGRSAPDRQGNVLTKARNIEAWREQGLEVVRRTEPADRPPHGVTLTPREEKLLQLLQRGQQFWTTSPHE